MATLNTRYLSTNRGIIKILQIVIGFIICSLLCADWYGGNTCFREGRLGFASGLNFVVVIINIVLLILNFLDMSMFHVERTYSVIVTVLYLIAALLVVWYIFEGHHNGTIVASAALLVAQFILFLWDVKIIQGEAPN